MAVVVHRHGPGLHTPPESAGHSPKMGQVQSPAQKGHAFVRTRLGEQKPPGPQFESTTQLLVVKHQLGALLELEGRHSQCPASQSESLKHWSYVHTETAGPPP